jgi:hypothetical protein
MEEYVHFLILILLGWLHTYKNESAFYAIRFIARDGTTKMRQYLEERYNFTVKKKRSDMYHLFDFVLDDTYVHHEWEKRTDIKCLN